MKHDFDMIIIGGGAAGLTAARESAGLGARTLVIEKKRLGGEFTWNGCIPAKALRRSAHIAALIRRLGDYGLSLSSGNGLRTDAVLPHVDDTVRAAAGRTTEASLAEAGITTIFGNAYFIDRDTVLVNNRRLTAKRFIVCTGSLPVIPDIRGVNDIPALTSKNIFTIERLPESLIVLGGGPVGMEMAQSLRLLGVRVMVVEILERILSQEDVEITRITEEQSRRMGIRLLTGKRTVLFEKNKNRIVMTLEDETRSTARIEAEAAPARQFLGSGDGSVELRVEGSELCRERGPERSVGAEGCGQFRGSVIRGGPGVGLAGDGRRPRPRLGRAGGGQRRIPAVQRGEPVRGGHGERRRAEARFSGREVVRGHG